VVQLEVMHCPYQMVHCLRFLCVMGQHLCPSLTHAVHDACMKSHRPTFVAFLLVFCWLTNLNICSVSSVQTALNTFSQLASGVSRATSGIFCTTKCAAVLKPKALYGSGSITIYSYDLPRRFTRIPSFSGINTERSKTLHDINCCCVMLRCPIQTS